MTFEERVDRYNKLNVEWLEIERWRGDNEASKEERKQASKRQIEIEREQDRLGIEFDEERAIDLFCVGSE